MKFTTFCLVCALLGSSLSGCGPASDAPVAPAPDLSTLKHDTETLSDLLELKAELAHYSFLMYQWSQLPSGSDHPAKQEALTVKAHFETKSAAASSTFAEPLGTGFRQILSAFMATNDKISTNLNSMEAYADPEKRSGVNQLVDAGGDFHMHRSSLNAALEMQIAVAKKQVDSYWSSL